MAKLYGPMYADIWCKALCLPGYNNLFKSLASEVADYFGVSQVEAESRLVENWEERSEIVARSFPKDKSPERLQSYYSNQEIYWVWLKRVGRA